MPQWTEADQTLAKGIQHELEVKEQRARRRRSATLRGPIPEEQRRGGGSDDIGDVSWNGPDGDAEVSVEHPGHAGPQLGERDLDGDADRAQGRDRRRESRRR